MVVHDSEMMRLDLLGLGVNSDRCSVIVLVGLEVRCLGALRSFLLWIRWIWIHLGSMSVVVFIRENTMGNVVSEFDLVLISTSVHWGIETRVNSS